MKQKWSFFLFILFSTSHIDKILKMHLPQRPVLPGRRRHEQGSFPRDDRTRRRRPKTNFSSPDWPGRTCIVAQAPKAELQHLPSAESPPSSRLARLPCLFLHDSKLSRYFRASQQPLFYPNKPSNPHTYPRCLAKDPPPAAQRLRALRCPPSPPLPRPSRLALRPPWPLLPRPLLLPLPPLLLRPPPARAPACSARWPALLRTSQHPQLLPMRRGSLPGQSC